METADFTRELNKELAFFGMGGRVTVRFIERILKRCGLELVKVQK